MTLGVSFPAALACGAEEEHPAPLSSFGGQNGASQSPGTSSGEGGNQPSGMGGHASGDGDGNDNGDGDSDTQPNLGFGGAVTGAPPDPTSPLCSLGANWGAAEELVGLTTPAEDVRLLSVSWDELTLVYFDEQDVRVFDRNQFDTEPKKGTPLDLSVDIDPSLGGAIGPDGLSLILVESQGRAFHLYSRASRSQAFEYADAQNVFDVLNALPGLGVYLSYPVLLEETLLWVETRDESSVWYGTTQSERYNREGQVGCSEFGCDYLLDGFMGYNKYITSMSTDGLSIFAMDELTGPEMRQRATPDSGFVSVRLLGHRNYPQINADCTRIYYSNGGRIYVESIQDI